MQQSEPRRSIRTCLLFAISEDLFQVLDIEATADYDRVFACVDNYEARMRASLLCRLAATDFISVGIDSRYLSVQRHPFGACTDDTAVACYECDLSPGVYRAIGERYSCGWLRKVAAATNLVPTTAVTASVSGGLAVGWALGAHAKDFPDQSYETRFGYKKWSFDANNHCR